MFIHEQEAFIRSLTLGGIFSFLISVVEVVFAIYWGWHVLKAAYYGCVIARPWAAGRLRAWKSYLGGGAP